MKYMVMECHLSYAVVLDENGSFLKVANMRYEVGQTVENVVEMASEVKGLSSKGYKKRFKALMATAACIIAALTAVLGVELMPCGSVYLNINPAVRLDVNRRDKVIGLEGINTDGESLIDGYAYRRKDVETVTDELVDRAVDMGYLHEGGAITITLDSDDDEWTASRGEAISESLGRHLDGKLSVTITVTDSAARTFEAVIPVESGDDDEPEVIPETVPEPVPEFVPDTPAVPTHTDDDDWDDDDWDDDDWDDNPDDDFDDDGLDDDYPDDVSDDFDDDDWDGSFDDDDDDDWDGSFDDDDDDDDD